MDAADELVAFASPYRHLDRDEAEMFILNQARLADCPEDKEAQRIAHHFASIFWWCREEISFEDFINDPRCPHPCALCNERNRRANERSLALFREARERGADVK